MRYVFCFRFSLDGLSCKRGTARSLLLGGVDPKYQPLEVQVKHVHRDSDNYLCLQIQKGL